MREHEEVRQKERLLSKKNEVRRKKKKLNLFFLFFFFIANNSEFPGLKDDRVRQHRDGTVSIGFDFSRFVSSERAQGKRRNKTHLFSFSLKQQKTLSLSLSLSLKLAHRRLCWIRLPP